jgi:hypothetical protein
MVRSGVLLCLCIVVTAEGAGAQTEPGPIPVFAADVRAAIPRFKADPIIASGLSVALDDLPTRGLGLVAGAHLYPLRGRVIAIGFGAEILTSRASRTKEPASEGEPGGPTVRTRLTAISPQVSFNFGHRDGWSYISGGLGSASLTSDIDPAGGTSVDDSPRSKTINYGGGARWFVRRHIAVSLDLRFYAVSPRTGTASAAGYPRMTVMVFTGGLGFR